MLLSRTRRSVLTAAAVAAVLWGCARIKISSDGQARPEADARAAVAGLVSDYQDRRAAPFFLRVDQDEFPNYETFRNDVRQFLLAVRQISMQVVVDRVGAAGSGVAADAHWNRTFVGRTGGEKVQKGTCSFVFTRAPSGVLLLAAIRGNSPF